LNGCTRKGRLLDLACGSGRHVRLALELGFEVMAVDRDAIAMASLPDAATAVRVDLEAEDAPARFFKPNAKQFDVVLVTNYLFRPHLQLVLDCVAPGGLLVYETFATGNAAFGRPSNPDFLLETREFLIRLSANWHILAYEDGIRDGRARIQRVAAIRDPEANLNALLAAHPVESA
jgi:SAM-dependent methyltransferase